MHNMIALGEYYFGTLLMQHALAARLVRQELSTQSGAATVVAIVACDIENVMHDE